MEWIHTSKLTSHPGLNHVCLFLRHLWWPQMNRDIKEYVNARPTCARNKRGNQPHSSLFQPFVDRFSKSAHFKSLTKLPTAQTALLLVNYVFRIHGIPIDVVSDQGPQFISQVWREFWRECSRASVSLTSGYHTLFNGQAERCNQKLEATLRCVIDNNPLS